jgi:hypothetical protein
MKILSVSRLGFCFAAVTIWGCGGKSEVPKIPLSQAQPGTTNTSDSVSPGAMPPGAQMALDSGNMLYRAKAYDQALAQYRRSAELAPNESAPLVGIFMVADVTKNKKLADSTLARMNALNPEAAATAAGMSQAEIRDIHSGMKTTLRPPSAKKE